MFENIPFTEVEGPRNEKDLMLFAISTCGFCRKAKKFLKKNGLTHKYIDVDTLDPVDKSDIAHEFKSHFGERIMYPCLIVDGKEFLFSFIRVQWQEKLAVKA